MDEPQTGDHQDDREPGPDATDAMANERPTNAPTSGRRTAEPEDADLVRKESYSCDGPAELDVSFGPGRVSIRLAEVNEVQVEVRHEPGWPVAGPKV